MGDPVTTAVVISAVSAGATIYSANKNKPEKPKLPKQQAPEEVEADKSEKRTRLTRAAILSGEPEGILNTSGTKTSRATLLGN